MSCPTCTRLERDETLLREGVEACSETLRFDLPEDVRAEVEEEGRLLAQLLDRILAARVASPGA